MIEAAAMIEQSIEGEVAKVEWEEAVVEKKDTSENSAAVVGVTVSVSVGVA